MIPLEPRNPHIPPTKQLLAHSHHDLSSIGNVQSHLLSSLLHSTINEVFVRNNGGRERYVANSVENQLLSSSINTIIDLAIRLLMAIQILYWMYIWWPNVGNILILQRSFDNLLGPNSIHQERIN